MVTPGCAFSKFASSCLNDAAKPGDELSQSQTRSWPVFAPPDGPAEVVVFGDPPTQADSRAPARTMSSPVRTGYCPSRTAARGIWHLNTSHSFVEATKGPSTQ